MTPVVAAENRVLILAPRGRDAGVIEQLLTKSGTPACICPDVATWVGELRNGAAATIITEEALVEADTASLDAWVDNQPPWSDFPFVMLATRRAGRRPARAAALIERLGNVVL